MRCRISTSTSRRGVLARPTAVDTGLIEGGEVRNVEMPFFELSYSYVEHATFVDCHFHDAVFFKSFLTDCTFRDCRIGRFRSFELGVKGCRFENVNFERYDIEELSAWGSSFDEVAFVSGRVGPNAFFGCAFAGLRVEDVDVTGRAGYALFPVRPDEETCVTLERLGVNIEVGDRESRDHL